MSKPQTVSCDDFLPRTHAHSYTRFSAARTSHARVRFAKILITHARVRFCVCVLSKFAHEHLPKVKDFFFFDMTRYKSRIHTTAHIVESVHFFW